MLKTPFEQKFPRSSEISTFLRIVTSVRHIFLGVYTGEILFRLRKKKVKTVFLDKPSG